MPSLLFIGPKFYNYHEIIKKGFEDAGYEVDYFDDRPSADFWIKVFVRLNKKLIKNKIRKHFNEIKQAVSTKKYDVIFVLYGQSFNKEMFSELKETSPDSKYIFYMYDPISSLPDRAYLVEVFDKCYSFDYRDCQKYVGFKFLPLFYSLDNYPKLEKKYDACFVGTMMPGKFSVVHKMLSELKEHGFIIFDFEYLQSKLVWLYYKIFKKDFRKSKLKDFYFNRISNDEANSILLSSDIIIDCPKEGQTGLTIRTFEALAANKKMITTNKTIKYYDFYKPENIYVYEGAFNFDDVFFKKEYQLVDSEIKKKYSINSWVNEILKGV